MNNDKKEFPINGLEHDVCTDWRKHMCYLQNIPGLTKWVKRKMNKRFRKSIKLQLRNDTN